MPDSGSKQMQYHTVRRPQLAEKIVFVDGQEGCGKTLFSALVSAFDRVEKLTYSNELEMICSMYYLNKLDLNGAATMVRLQTDHILYETMQSREVNCRPGDLSSIFKDPNTWRYIKRFFQPGEGAVPDRVRQERPILALTVHRLLGIAQPVLEGLKDRAVFIEIVRHPLYMIIQQTLNNEQFIEHVREFNIYFDHSNKTYPWYAAGWEELFAKSNPAEKAIYNIQKFGEMTDRSKSELISKYGMKVLTIPFEKFVVDPEPFMKEMEELLGSKITVTTRQMMKKQKIPRQKISDGIPLAIYKRCGWVPPRPGATEENELEIRRQYAAKTASPEAMKVLHQLCGDYEEKYMGGRIIKGDHYE